MITIDVSIEDGRMFDTLTREAPEDVTLVKLKRFEGSADILQAAITLTALTIPLVAKIIIEQIKSKRYISIKYRGIEIKGIPVSKKHVVELLTKLPTEKEDQ